MRRRIFSRSLSFIFNYFDPEVAVYRGTGIPRALFPSTPFFTLLVILLLILQLPPLLSVQFLPAARFVLFSFHKLTSNFKRNPHLRNGRRALRAEVQLCKNRAYSLRLRGRLTTPACRARHTIKSMGMDNEMRVRL